jgi:D-sedoheptulose 7-phosphate isomerase
MTSFSSNYLTETTAILENINTQHIESLVIELKNLKNNLGRLYICGLGGSAGHASHAVNDFRKLCEINAISPTDNVSELTARANDEGWGTVFSGFLSNSNITNNDALLIFSVGGGSLNPPVSVPLIEATKYAMKKGAKIFSVVGRDGGFIKEVSDISILVPNLFPDKVTPHTEGLTAVLWHLIVSHPELNSKPTKW